MRATVSVIDASILCEINRDAADATISQRGDRGRPFVDDGVLPESVVREGGSDAAGHAGPLYEL